MQFFGGQMTKLLINEVGCRLSAIRLMLHIVVY